MEVQRVNVLGVNVSAINMGLALETICKWIEKRERHYVCVTGVHGIMESQRDESLRKIHNQAGMVTTDGMPLVWINRLYGHRDVERVYGPDLMLAVCKFSIEKGYRHYFYGGAPGVPELLASQLTGKFPGICVAGTYSPPYRKLTDEEDKTVMDQINRANPDIVWVGLSTPKQERWMAEHRSKLDAPVLIGVGAAFDFHAGLKKQAPVWIQHSGFEWLFRLMNEPGRLWKRYFTNNPIFVILIIAQLLGIKHYPDQ